MISDYERFLTNNGRDRRDFVRLGNREAYRLSAEVDHTTSPQHFPVAYTCSLFYLGAQYSPPSL